MVRKSKRIAAKQDTKHLDMTTKVILNRAKQLDTYKASASLSSALNASKILDSPELPVASASSLTDIARACGADEAEAALIANARMISPAP